MSNARSFCNNNISFVFIVALLSVSLASACSDPDLPKNVVVPSGDVSPTTDSGTPDSDQSDTNATDVDTDMGNGIEFPLDVDDLDVNSDTGQDTEEDSDITPGVDEPNPYPQCGPVVDLGWLMPGKQTLSIDLSKLENRLNTGCSNAKPDSNEAVFSFRLYDEGILSLSSSSPVASELRRRPCENDDLGLFCKENGFSEHVAGAGIWFLVLEDLSQSADGILEVELGLEPTPRCDERGTAQCEDGNTIVKCDLTATSPDIARLTRGTCAQGCSNGRCVGDSCDAPIVVTGQVEVSGNGAVYFDTHDSRAGDSCDQDPLAYDEPELVFELSNLKAGNKVIVKTTGEIVPHNILIKTSCEETSACVGYFEETSPASWEVPNDGTYYMFVENGGWAPSEFQISIEIMQD